MRQTYFIAISIILLLASCQNNNDASNSSTTVSKPKSYFQKLFITLEANKTDKCGAGGNIDGGLNGCLYFTKKGNVLYHLNNETSDTVSYLWGNYSIKDSSITISLNNEYYYAGKWDARWDVANPDYKKGKTRKVPLKEITIYKTRCDSDSYFRPYSEVEIKEAEQRLKNQTAGSFYYMPYYNENKDMKFYTWLFKQIPVLADL